MAKKCGATVKDVFWTLGEYDVVAVVEAPDDISMTALGLSTGALGNVRTQTLRACTQADMKTILDKMVKTCERGRSIVPSTSLVANSKAVATYDYTDADGTLLHQVIRYEPKGFSQRQPDGKGGWINNLDGCRRVPYRLPELLKYPDAEVYHCEGEKDANRLAALGLCTTTVVGGKMTDDCVKYFAGRNVVIIEDADRPGGHKALDR